MSEDCRYFPILMFPSPQKFLEDFTEHEIMSLLLRVLLERAKAQANHLARAVKEAHNIVSCEYQKISNSPHFCEPLSDNQRGLLLAEFIEEALKVDRVKPKTKKKPESEGLIAHFVFDYFRREGGFTMRKNYGDDSGYGEAYRLINDWGYQIARNGLDVKRRKYIKNNMVR